MYEETKLNSPSQTGLAGAVNPTQREIEIQDKATSQLGDVIQTLTARLSVVLREEGPEKDSGATPQERLSPLPDTLRAHTQRVIRATNSLQSILSRLEL